MGETCAHRWTYQNWFVVLKCDGLPLDAFFFILLLLHEKDVLRKEKDQTLSIDH